MRRAGSETDRPELEALNPTLMSLLSKASTCSATGWTSPRGQQDMRSFEVDDAQIRIEGSKDVLEKRVGQPVRLANCIRS